MKKILHFILFLALCSCSTENTTEQKSSFETIHIKELSDCNIVGYSDVYDSVRFIALETSKECLIGHIDILISYKDRFFILDKFISKSVMAFNAQGNFINKIGALGQGPGEFLNPAHMAIDPYKDQILMYDNLKKCILSYDLDGNYLQSINLEFRIDAFDVIFPDKIALYYNYYGNENIRMLPKHNIHVVNERGKVIKKYFNRENSIKPNHSGINHFSHQNNKLLFNASFDNNILEYTENGFLIKYKIDFGEKGLNEDRLKKMMRTFQGKEILFDEIDNSDYTYITGFQETGNFLILTTSYKKKLYSIIYSKSTKNITISNIYLNDLNGLIPGGHIIFNGFPDDCIVSYFYPSEISLDYYQDLLNKSLNDSDYIKNQFLHNINKIDNSCNRVMKKIIENNIFSCKKEEFNIVKALDYNSNPVLVIGKLKTF